MSNPEGEEASTDGRERWPIGFMLLIGALTIYLGWRLIQGVTALIGWLVG